MNTIRLALCVAGVSMAAVPHKFTAGTPAKADSVNANFDYLDNALKSKANQAALDSIKAQLASSPTAAGKASQGSVDTLKLIVSTKADTAELNAVKAKLSGTTGPQGPKGDSGAMGPAGPQGIQGPKGDVGPVGPVGPQGPKGDSGAMGLRGPQGIQGLKGDVGATGPVGPQGPKGDSGAMGLRGPQGIQGLKGDPGAAGPAGPQGLKGDVGAVGPAGPQGLKGDVGAVGPAGPQGAPGVTPDLTAYATKTLLSDGLAGKADQSWVSSNFPKIANGKITAATFLAKEPTTQGNTIMIDPSGMSYNFGIGNISGKGWSLTEGSEGSIQLYWYDGFRTGYSPFDVSINGDVSLGATGKTVTVSSNLVVSNSITVKGIPMTVPDYVFEPGYKLATLPEIEAFTKANKHLPEVPSAAEVEKGGLDLAKMNLTLLKKVEELTLHAIAQNKQLESQAAQIQAQNERLQALEASRN